MLFRTDKFNALATDLNLDLLQQAQASIGGISIGLGGQGRLQVDLVDQITVAGDLAGDTAVEADSAVEGLLNGLHREVSVATVDDLEDFWYPKFPRGIDYILRDYCSPRLPFSR
jgi:hypothetical protein